MPPLKTLLITDGRAGHVTLSKGIIAAIARLRTVEVRELTVARPYHLPGRALSALTNSGVAPKTLLKSLYGINALPFEPSLIVSSGADTLAANVALKLLHPGAINLFYGSLRGYRDQDFSLVLNSYAKHAANSKYFVTLKPNAADPDEIVPERNPAISPSHPPQRAGLLLGGDTRELTFSSADWRSVADFVLATYKAHGTRWMISNSRRTPDAASALFEEFGRDPAGAVQSFIDVRRAGSGTLRQVFEFAEAVAVTSDSSSMLSEAIWMRKPVLAIEPSTGTLTEDESGYRAYLEGNSWSASAPATGLSPDAWLAKLSDLTPLKNNPLDALSTELFRRVPQLLKI